VLKVKGWLADATNLMKMMHILHKHSYGHTSSVFCICDGFKSTNCASLVLGCLIGVFMLYV